MRNNMAFFSSYFSLFKSVITYPSATFRAIGYDTFFVFVLLFIARTFEGLVLPAVQSSQSGLFAVAIYYLLILCAYTASTLLIGYENIHSLAQHSRHQFADRFAKISTVFRRFFQALLRIALVFVCSYLLFLLLANSLDISVASTFLRITVIASSLLCLSALVFIQSSFVLRLEKTISLLFSASFLQIILSTIIFTAITILASAALYLVDTFVLLPVFGMRLGLEYFAVLVIGYCSFFLLRKYAMHVVLDASKK